MPDATLRLAASSTHRRAESACQAILSHRPTARRAWFPRCNPKKLPKSVARHPGLAGLICTVCVLVPLSDLCEISAGVHFFSSLFSLIFFFLGFPLLASLSQLSFCQILHRQKILRNGVTPALRLPYSGAAPISWTPTCSELFSDR